MSILLPNSVFYHVGRTGGHWVNEVLWRAGLIERRLLPLHADPTQLVNDLDVQARQFSFCFVRHPARWAASLWQHEMEYGWSDCELSDLAADDCFANFLEKLIIHYPNGACSATMTPFVDACNFVGRLESLKSDLSKALHLAGENFSEDALEQPPINTSRIAALKHATFAPREILSQFMATEHPFCERFDYHDHPEELEGAITKVIRPRLPLKLRIDEENSKEFSDVQLLSSTRFDYNFSNGQSILSKGHATRIQWAAEAVIEKQFDLGRCAVVSESDPLIAYLISQKSSFPVTTVSSDVAVVPARLMAMLDNPLLPIDFRTFHSPEYQEAFDTIFLVDSAQINPLFDTELFNTTSLLKPGGTMLFLAPTLKVDVQASALFPLAAGVMQGRKLSYKSFSYWQILCANYGLGDIKILDEFVESPGNEVMWQEVEKLAHLYGVSPEQILGYALISAKKSTDEDSNERIRRMGAQWIGRSLVDMTDLPYDFLPDIVEARLRLAEAEARTERERRDIAEQNTANREQELFAAQRAIEALTADANYSRDQLILEREKREMLQRDLDSTRNLLRAMKVDNLLKSD